MRFEIRLDSCVPQVESDGEFARKLQDPEGGAGADGGEEGVYGGEDGACGGRLAGAADDEHWRQQVITDHRPLTTDH